MKRTAAAIAAFLFSLAAPSLAEVHGTWPDSAYARALPSPGWVLVIPARRNADGSVTLWDRNDPWSRQWIVPQPTPGGLKTVSLLGDSEDARQMEGWQVDAMDVSGLGAIAGKYGAPAVAVAVTDEGGAAAVAAWTPGRGASWVYASYGGDDLREASLAAIDVLFSGGPGDGREHAGGQGFEWDEAPDVRIVGQRMTHEGTEYLVEASSREFLYVIESLGGLEVQPWFDSDGMSVIVRVTDGRSVESVLSGAGLRLGQP